MQKALRAFIFKSKFVFFLNEIKCKHILCSTISSIDMDEQKLIQIFSDKLVQSNSLYFFNERRCKIIITYSLL